MDHFNYRYKVDHPDAPDLTEEQVVDYKMSQNMTLEESAEFLEQVERDHGWHVNSKIKHDKFAAFKTAGDGCLNLQEMTEFENDRQKV